MQRAILYFAISASLSMLCACAGTLVDAPSLNKRAFEISLEEMRAQAGIGANVDSIITSDNLDRNDIALGLDDEVEMIWKTHNKADSNFAAQSSNVQLSVRNALNTEFGSDNWSTAHVAISRLERTRALSLKSLSALDEIIFAKLDNKAPNQNIDRLLQLQKLIQTDVETQNQFLNNLSSSLANR